MSIWHIGILTAVPRLVPKEQRAEWLAEWRGELWHVKAGAAIFCLGSFRDAAWLRRNSPREQTLTSPACFCFFWLLWGR